MANMALNIEQRLGQKLTPEQQILWDYVLQRWPNAVIRPYYYTGLFAGNELSIYEANKIYVAYSVVATGTTMNSVANGFAVLYDAANAIHLHLSNMHVVWDATAAAIKYGTNNIGIKNVWCSRIGLAVYNAISFVGYRLTI